MHVMLQSSQVATEFGRYHVDTKSSTSFFSDKDMTPEELEALPQFIAFVSETDVSKFQSQMPLSGKTTSQALARFMINSGKQCLT